MWFISLVLVAALCGCATRGGVNHSTRTSKALGEASLSVQSELEALDRTMSSLDGLVNAGEGDLRPLYKNYASALDRLKKDAQRTTATGRDLDHTTTEYLAAWDAELAAVEFENVRERSQVRRREVESYLAAVRQRYSEAQESVDPLVRYFTDIRIILSTDLNVDGLNNVRPVVANARDNSAKVRAVLQNLRSDLKTFGDRLSARGAEVP